MVSQAALPGAGLGTVIEDQTATGSEALIGTVALALLLVAGEVAELEVAAALAPPGTLERPWLLGRGLLLAYPCPSPPPPCSPC